MKAPVTLSSLARERRTRSRASKRSNAATKAKETKRRTNGRPSELLVSWRSKAPSRWNANDALGYYATRYVEVVGSEDVELKTKEAQRRGAALLRKLLDDLDDGECPREYVRWAVEECAEGKGYPSDNVPSVTAICYRRILLKRWRIRERAADVATRGREWAEG